MTAFSPIFFPKKKKNMKISKKIFLPACAAISLLLFPSCIGPFFSVFPSDAEKNPPRHFVLSAGTPDAGAQGEIRPILFERITVPAYLDVPQIVTGDGLEVRKSERNRWGEPLARGVARALELRTAAALAGTPAAAVSGKSARVALSRFDGTPDGNVEISAVYTLTTETDAGTESASRRFDASVKVEAPNDFAAYVRALDSALELLARDIAAQIRR